MGKHANKQNVFPLEQAQPDRKKSFHVKDLCSFHARSDNQNKFIQSWYETNEDTFGLFGYPGTGKTFLAIRCGMDDVLDPDIPEFKKLIIVRSAVELRETGYKPGDENDKSMVYAKPYYGLMQDVFGNKFKKVFENLMENGTVQFETTSNNRGTTWDNAIVVMDEVQNMNYEEIRTIYTRGGRDCRFVFCGDLGQNDLIRKKNDVSGLEQWMKVMQEMESTVVEFYDLEDIVRDGRIRSMIEAEIALSFV